MSKSYFYKTKKAMAIMTAIALLVGNTITLTPTNKVLAAENQQSTMRSVMYYTNWSNYGGFLPEDIQGDKLTHLNLAFMDIDSDGHLVSTDSWSDYENGLGKPGTGWQTPNAGLITLLKEEKAKNPNLKIGVSLGGWTKSADFSGVTADVGKRTVLVNEIVKFLDYAEMDFVDIDWEYPGIVREPNKVDNGPTADNPNRVGDEGTPYSKPEDKENYILFLQDLRKALDLKEKETKKQYEISVALSANQNTLKAGVDVKRMFEIVDFANLMTYDLRGAGDTTSGHHTALYGNPNDPMNSNGFNIDDTVKYMLKEGAPSNKLVVGAAFYTRGWEKVSKGSDPNLPGLFGQAELANKDADGKPSRGAYNEAPMEMGNGGLACGIWSYRSIDSGLKAKYPGLKEYWDDVAKAPYLYDEVSGAFFTYDNPKSIAEKAKYVKDNNLGGMIAWEQSQDKETLEGSKVRDELTTVMKNGLFGDGPITGNTNNGFKNLNIGIDIKATPVGYDFVIKNNETLIEETWGSNLWCVEQKQKVIKLPKLYVYNNDGPLEAIDGGINITEENEVNIIDTSKTEAIMIAPGETYTIKVKTKTPPTDISNIKVAELSQSMHIGDSDFTIQCVYSNLAPIISGEEVSTITEGDAFNPLTGIKAEDFEDGDITANIKVEGTVNTNLPGEYKLVYTVKDSNNNEGKLLRIVKVIAKAEEVAKPSVPKTGDNSNTGLVFMFGLMFLASGGVVLKLRKKNI